MRCFSNSHILLCIIITISFNLFCIVSPEGSVEIDPSNIDASFDDNVTFICSSLGGPYNQYQWTHLETDNIVSNDPQLTISSVSFDNGGNYQCEVSNMAGNDIAVSSLNSKSLHR